MLRMPIGLISLEYLFKAFGDPNYKMAYGKDIIQPSVECDESFGSGDVHVFQWDIDRRLEEWQGEGANDWERKRLNEWKRLWHEDFINGRNGEASSYPSIFTPSTVKALNLFFNCSERGKALAAEYKKK